MLLVFLFPVHCQLHSIAQLVADVHIGDITSTTAMVIVINDEIYSFSLYVSVSPAQSHLVWLQYPPTTATFTSPRAAADYIPTENIIDVKTFLSDDSSCAHVAIKL